jgi:WhiB family redox-sensing transcriptional regulator
MRNEAVASGSLARPGVARTYSIDVDVPPWLRGDEPLPCLLANPELFFPDLYTDMTQIKMVREVCRGCPVRDLCLEWAVASPGEEGLWAGTTPPERRRIRTRGTYPAWMSQEGTAA